MDVTKEAAVDDAPPAGGSKKSDVVEDEEDEWTDEEEGDDDGGGWDDDEEDPDLEEEKEPMPPMKRHQSLMVGVEIKGAMEEELAPLLDIGFEFNFYQAKRIAHTFKWKVMKAKSELLEDPDKVYKKCGIIMEPRPSALPTEDEAECAFCYEDRAKVDFRSPLSCGHSVCAYCWIEMIMSSTSAGLACLDLKCPNHGCGCSLTDDVVLKILLDKNIKPDPTDDSGMDSEEFHKSRRATWEKYQKWSRKHFVDNDKNLSFCPSPDCSHVTRYVAGMVRCIECNCGWRWCWYCKLEDHTPASCQNAEEWAQKYSDESETVKYVMANTKPCPGCSAPIEKNQGCNHMTCRSAMGCGHEFCWLCLGDWNDHGQKTGGYYKCTIYEDKKASGKLDDEEKKKENLKNDLARYSKFLEYYDNRMKAAGFAKKQIENLKDKLKLKHGGDISSMNFDFVFEALEEIQKNNRMIAWIYVLQYYFFPTPKTKAKLSLLQQQQGYLFTFCDKLQGMTEQFAEDLEKLYQKRGQINGLIKDCRNYRGRLSDVIALEWTDDVLHI